MSKIQINSFLFVRCWVVCVWDRQTEANCDGWPNLVCIDKPHSTWLAKLSLQTVSHYHYVSAISHLQNLAKGQSPAWPAIGNKMVTLVHHQSPWTSAFSVHGSIYTSQSRCSHERADRMPYIFPPCLPLSASRSLCEQRCVTLWQKKTRHPSVCLSAMKTHFFTSETILTFLVTYNFCAQDVALLKATRGLWRWVSPMGH